MPNITFSVPDDLYERLKRFPENKWSTLYREAIERYLERFENPEVIGIAELKSKLTQKGITMDDLTHEQVIENYKKIKDLKWERIYSIRTR